ncbi:MAG: YiiX/YebB-like N1pC/P60 family cysteine hydrolase, partial [Natronospirillum sp.]
MFQTIGRALAGYLTKPDPHYQPVATSEPSALLPALQRGDVLLVEGSSRVSTAIKYLTQSTWSHAALYVGDVLIPGSDGQSAHALLEADMRAGVRLVPINQYAAYHTRICRPVGLHEADIDRLIAYAMAHGVR